MRGVTEIQTARYFYKSTKTIIARFLIFTAGIEFAALNSIFVRAALLAGAARTSRAQQENTNALRLTVSIVHVVRSLVVFAALNN